VVVVDHQIPVTAAAVVVAAVCLTHRKLLPLVPPTLLLLVLVEQVPLSVLKRVQMELTPQYLFFH
jgi:hypothetical protein